MNYVLEPESLRVSPNGYRFPVSTNESSKPDKKDVIKFNFPFDNSSIVNSPGYKNMVASINAATKVSEQHAALVAATEK